MKRSAIMLLCLLPALPLVQPVEGGGGSTEYKEMIYQDLRNGGAVMPPFNLVGDPLGNHTNPEPAGLRISLPAKREDLDGVGLDTKFKVSGDFEITAGYELLAADVPIKAPNVVGPNLFIMQTGDGNHKVKPFARFGRYRTTQGHVYAFNYLDPTRSSGGNSKRFPTKEMSGQLRLTRKGSQLSFLVKDATTGGEFKELAKGEFGSNDLNVIRFVVNTDKKPFAVDARLIDFRIRSGAVTSGAGSASSPPSEQSPSANPTKETEKTKDTPSRGWLAAALILGLLFMLLLLIAGGAWFLIHKRRSGRSVAEHDAASTAKGSSIAFICPKCDKNLKAKAEFIGKKVKCSGCGNAVLVPQAEV